MIRHKISCHFLTLLLLSVFFISLSHAQWITINPSLSNGLLNDVAFFNPSDGIAISNLGEIASTADGGNTWSILSQPVTTSLNAISLSPTHSVAYIVGHKGVILKSTDAGRTWQQIQFSSTSDLYAVDFISDSYGFIVGKQTYKTTDGGNTWLSQNTYAPGILHGIDVVTEGTVFAVGEQGTVVRTSDGGSSWIQNYVGSTNTFKDIYFVDALHGCISGTQSFYTDVGGTGSMGGVWTRTPGPSSQLSFYGSIGYCSSGDTIKKSTNAGMDWTNTGIVKYGSKSIAPISSTFLLSVGSYGSISQSIDAGLTWEQMVGPTTLSSLWAIKFFSQSTGIIAGSDSTLLLSTNSGTTWQQITNAFYSGSYKNISLANDQTGFLVGRKKSPLRQVLMRTTNQGATWDTIPFPRKTILQIYFRNNFGYVLSDSGFLLRTTNQGVDWATLHVDASRPIDLIYFTDQQEGFFTSSFTFNQLHSNDSCFVTKTTNAGAAWNRQYLGKSFILSHVSFADSNIGFIAGEVPQYLGGSRIFRTTNRGSTWTSIESPYNGPSYERAVFRLTFTGVDPRT